MVKGSDTGPRPVSFDVRELRFQEVLTGHPF